MIDYKHNTKVVWPLILAQLDWGRAKLID